MNIASLILGIVGLLFSLIPCLGMYALPLTVLAMIFGIVALKQEKKGMAIAGLICASLGTMMASYWLYVYLTVKDDMHDAFHKLGTELKDDLDKAEKRQKQREERRRLGEEQADPLPPVEDVDGSDGSDGSAVERPDPPPPASKHAKPVPPAKK